MLKKLLLLPLLLLVIYGRSQNTGNKVDTFPIDEKIFQKVEIEASYPGGDSAWRKFLEKNLNPNVPVDNGAPVGRYTVMVQFYVNKSGIVSDVKPLTKFGYGMEREVVELIKKSGAWNPAIQDKRPVNAYRKQPVTFIMEQDGFTIDSETPFVLFTGANNEINVRVNKVKPDDLSLTITQGTVTPAGGGKFIAKVSKPGKAIITVFNKKNKEIASAYFEVKDRE